MTKKSVLSVIFSRTAHTDAGCIEYTKSHDKDGYGRISFKTPGKYRRVHRIVYEETFGPIQDGVMVLHKCDNPPCCNPAHLFLGTAKNNAEDREQKGRSQNVSGDNNPMAILTDEQTMEILKHHANGIAMVHIAKKYGVCFQTISLLIRGTNRPHCYAMFHGREPAEIIAKPRLTRESVEALRIEAAVGVTRKELGAKYGISLAQVCRIISRQKWKT